ncbi:MAG: hypothetical protein NTX33_13820 [Propionibacteriales bacterium]|nr:hypothetical protein [Propionibacteriales bacterium]
MAATLGTQHLTLRPGVPVMARSPGILQVGLDEPALRVDDDPAVRRILVALARPSGVPPDEELPPKVLDVLARLDLAGLLVTVSDAERHADPALVTLRAQFGSDAVRRQEAHSAAAIAVRGNPASIVALGPLLERAGLREASATDPNVAVHLFVTSGPLDRVALDSLVRGSVPHLLVSGSATRRRIGPFVQPGLTACLRCVDAHEALHDPRRPLLLAQAAATATERPPPLDPVLDQLALAWAVRDLARYLEGDEPSTWSSTVDVSPVDAPERTRWGRHPDCGCAWDAITELP